MPSVSKTKIKELNQVLQAQRQAQVRGSKKIQDLNAAMRLFQSSYEDLVKEHNTIGNRLQALEGIILKINEDIAKKETEKKKKDEDKETQ